MFKITIPFNWHLKFIYKSLLYLPLNIMTTMRPTESMCEKTPRSPQCNLSNISRCFLHTHCGMLTDTEYSVTNATFFDLTGQTCTRRKERNHLTHATFKQVVRHYDMQVVRALYEEYSRISASVGGEVPSHSVFSGLKIRTRKRKTFIPPMTFSVRA